MSYESLDIDGFADKLKVSSSTVKTWKDRGRLVRGRHYFQEGRIVRFFWGELLIRMLMEDNVGSDETTCPLEPASVSIASAGTKPAGKDPVSPTDGAIRCSAGKPTSTLPVEGGSNRGKASKRKTRLAGKDTSTLPVEGGSNRGKDSKRKTRLAGKDTSTSPVEGGSNRGKDSKRKTRLAGKHTSTSPVEGGSNRGKDSKPKTQINWDYR